MKNTFYLLAIVSSCFLLSCKDHDQKNDKDKPHHGHGTGSNSTQPISIDTANKMLLSYLHSVNYQSATDTNLTSIIINADSLRNYLNDTANRKIKYVKVMFAHTLDYINNGGKDNYCGYNLDALTFIVVGYDSMNNYVYNAQNMVYDRFAPCPNCCPTSGTASQYLLPPPKTR